MRISETPAPTAAKNAVQDETVYDEPRLVRTLKRANLRKKPDGSRLGEIAADTALTAIGEVEKDGELWLHIEKGKNNKEATCIAELGAPGQARGADSRHRGRSARAVPRRRPRSHRGDQK